MANTDINPGDKPVSDLKDSAKDLAEMKSEPVTIDIPDVKDIPGQENIVPAPLGELADVTISSSDEEGEGLFDDVDDETGTGSGADVSASEIRDLEEAANDMPTEDDANLHEAELDDTDEDGIPLNEGSSRHHVTGSDLDIPGTEEDDEEEQIGEEDEENNEYSLGGDDHDDIPEDNF